MRSRSTPYRILLDASEPSAHVARATVRTAPRPRRFGRAGARLDPRRYRPRGHDAGDEAPGDRGRGLDRADGGAHDRLGHSRRGSRPSPARQIDAWEPRLLADALATQPGISLYDDLGSAYKLNLSTRGFNVGPVVGLPPGVSVFLDGVRQNEPDAAEVNFDLLPMEHVRRVELLSGSGSLLGANSLGGAINLITRRGDGPLEGELELSGGSYGAASGEGSLGGVTAGQDGLLRRRRLRARGRLARGHRRAQLQRLRQPRPPRRAARHHASRRSAPSRAPRPRARCPRASSTCRPRPTSPSATSRTSTCCRAPCRATRRSVRGSGRSRPTCAARTPSGSTSTRRPTTTSARSPPTARWAATSTGAGPLPLGQRPVLSPPGRRRVGQPGPHPALHRESGGRRRP